MAEQNTPAIIYLLAMIAITFILLSVGKKKYGALVQPLSTDDFGLKDLFPIGFLIMDISRHNYAGKFDRKLIRQLRELYDPDYTDYYLRVHWAAAATYVVIGFVFSGLLWNIIGIAGLPVGIALGGVMAYASFNDIQKKIDERHEKILIAMPDFTNKIVILSGAGMTLRGAIIKVAKEMSVDTPLYQELQHCVKMMENGTSDEKALSYMTLRCNTPQMRRFISVALQNMKRGGSDVIAALQEIGQEQWAERKAAAMRLSAAAETKLLFPMLLMLGSVIVMTVAPAVMSIGF